MISVSGQLFVNMRKPLISTVDFRRVVPMHFAMLLLMDLLCLCVVCLGAGVGLCVCGQLSSRRLMCNTAKLDAELCLSVLCCALVCSFARVLVFVRLYACSLVCACRVCVVRGLLGVLGLRVLRYLLCDNNDGILTNRNTDNKPWVADSREMC